MKTFKLPLSAATVLALCSGVAQASPIVTSWSVTNTATFVPASVLPVSNVYPKPVLTLGNTQLHWGDATSQSGLIINNSGSAVVVPTGVLTSTVSITHQNFPIPAGDSLTAVDILASLTLNSLTPSVGPVAGAAITFGVRFIETPNAGTAGICANGGTPGVGINSAGCADIFVISQNALNFPFLYDSDGAINGADPEPYFASFFADGFNTLSNASCAAAGAANGCRGFETAESARTTADFKILITSTPFQVPEPGSMALIGGALTALAWVSRRRKPLES